MINVRKRSLSSLDYYPMRQDYFNFILRECSLPAFGLLAAFITATHKRGDYGILKYPEYLFWYAPNHKPKRQEILEKIFSEHLQDIIRKLSISDGCALLNELIDSRVLRLRGQYLYYDQMIKDEKDYASGKNNFKID